MVKISRPKARALEPHSRSSRMSPCWSRPKAARRDWGDWGEQGESVQDASQVSAGPARNNSGKNLGGWCGLGLHVVFGVTRSPCGLPKQIEHNYCDQRYLTAVLSSCQRQADIGLRLRRTSFAIPLELTEKRLDP